MQLETLPPTAFVQAFERIDPFVAAVDGDGTILDRRAARNGRVPEDLRSAGSLRAVLSPPVLGEWLRMIRSTMSNGLSHSAMAILDGRAVDVLSMPNQPAAEATRRSALLGIFQSPMVGEGADTRAPRPSWVPLTLTEHEWGPLENLTRCQLDTLRRVSLGMSNDEIARSIFRTKRAVEWHIRFLNETLGVHGRERLGMIGRDAGLHLFADDAWTRVLKTRPARRAHVPVAVGSALQPA